MATEKDLNQQITDNSDASVTEVTEVAGVSRRKFTRNVLLGSAVVLTLSNRSAWGGAEIVGVSASLLDSYRYHTAYPSRLTDKELCELDKYLRYEDEALQPPSYNPDTGDMEYKRNFAGSNPEIDCTIYVE